MERRAPEPPIRVHVTGAAGAGVSTLGRELARRLGAACIDVDDAYWAASDPPFQVKRSIAERLALLRPQPGGPRWVLSGSLDGWGDALVRDATHVVFLDTAVAVRLERIRAREQARFDARVRPGGDMHAQHEAFLAWAAAYDDGSQGGRSRPRHLRWLAGLSMPVMRLDGVGDPDALAGAVMERVSARAGANRSSPSGLEGQGGLARR